jgi:hypothetical protein
MTERKTTYANANGVRRTLITDDDRPGVVVHTQQVLDEILAGIHRDREAANDNTMSVNKLVARLPVEVFERAVLQGWDEDDWRRYLNSSEAAPFRIWQGRV